MTELLTLVDARVALQSLQVGTGLVMAITAAEVLVGPQVYARSGLLTWDLVRQTPPWVSRPALQRVADAVYAESLLRRGIVLRVLLGLALVGCGLLAWFPPLLLGAALLSTVWLLMRAQQGQDGAFQLRLMVLCVLFTCSVSPWDSAPFCLGLHVLSVQLVLSYFLAGIAKLRGASWRDGTGIVGLFGTRYHGVGWMYGLLAPRPWLAKLASWAIIAFELAYPLVFLGDEWLLVGLLGLGAAFHLAVAFTMGLNSFLLSFVAAYPTLVFSWLALRS